MINGGAVGHFEPEVTRTFLPGCGQCGGSHPLARRPQQPEGKCPDCGASVAGPGPTLSDRGIVHGAWLGMLLLRIGAWLSNLARE